MGSTVGATGRSPIVTFLKLIGMKIRVPSGGGISVAYGHAVVIRDNKPIVPRGANDLLAGDRVVLVSGTGIAASRHNMIVVHQVE